MTEVPGTLQNVDFIEKDSKFIRGWGCAVFDCDVASASFTRRPRKTHCRRRRRRVRGRVSHDRTGKELHLQGLREEVNGDGILVERL